MMILSVVPNYASINCIFLCQFHTREGPKITFQVPKDHKIADDFRSLHEYLIPKEELQQKLITVKACGHKILGCPVYIKNNNYDRNAFIFNVCFVFRPDTNTSCYERVLKKLVHYLTVLETESGYLSRNETGYTRSERPPLPKKEYLTPVQQVLEQVLRKLNDEGACAIPIDEANTIHLKLVPSFEVPIPIRDFDVPVLTFDPLQYRSHEWDLATQQVLPCIDGFKHIALVATEAEIDIRLVKALVQNLMYFKLVEIITIFQYSNVYMVTSEINKFYTNTHLQDKCVQAVALSANKLPKFDDVMKLLSCFMHGTTVKHVCMRQKPRKLGIDERKLIQFAVIHKFLRRIHKYPVRTCSTSESSASHTPQSAGGTCSPIDAAKLCDGYHSYDEICCSLNISYQELDHVIEEDPNIYICWK